MKVSGVGKEVGPTNEILKYEQIQINRADWNNRGLSESLTIDSF